MIRLIWLVLAMPVLLIESIDPEDVTYLRDVEPIIRTKCTPCHSPGGPAPFSLLSYQDVQKRANQVAIALIDRTMPPNRATSDVGPFSYIPAVSPDEIAKIHQWSTQGQVRGTGEELSAPEQKRRWRLGEPDVIVEPNVPYNTQADDRPHWRVYRVRLPHFEGKILKAIDINPDVPSVIRHVQVALSGPPDGPTAGPGSIPIHSLVGTWSYGYHSIVLPEEAGIDLTGVDEFVLHVFVQPSGRRESAGLAVGLHFGGGNIEPQIIPLRIPQGHIPPSPAYMASSRITIPIDIKLLSLIPDFRDLASEITILAFKPDGSIVRLFHLEGWSTYWIGAYRYLSPVHLPAGTSITLDVRYNNSTHNVQNLSNVPTRVPIGVAAGEEPGSVALQALAY
jgi:hypothetical protein